MQKSASLFYSGVTLSGISSMATRLSLTDIAGPYRQEYGVSARFESAGGVDAAKRVRAGEAFELVAPACDAIGDERARPASLRAPAPNDLKRRRGMDPI